MSAFRSHKRMQSDAPLSDWRINNALIKSQWCLLMRTLHNTDSTGCESSDSTSHSIISRSGLEIFVYQSINQSIVDLYSA